MCGIRVQQKYLGIINKAINDIKIKYFATKEVEIKSDWLRNPSQRKKYYISKYNIDESGLKEFVNEIYELIGKHIQELKLIAIVFDKRFYGDNKREIVDGSPLLKCAQILFERLHYLMV